MILKMILKKDFKKDFIIFKIIFKIFLDGRSFYHMIDQYDGSKSGNGKISPYLMKLSLSLCDCQEYFLSFFKKEYAIGICHL